MTNTVFTAKNRPLLILLAVLALIPAVVAAHFHSRTGVTSLSKDTVRVDVYEPGAYYPNVTKSFTDKADVTFYTDLLASSRLIDENFRPLDGMVPYYVFLYDERENQTLYAFYPSAEAGDCIYTDEEGKYYMLADDAAVKLFNRPEFAAANVYGALPAASVTVGDTVVTLGVESGSWHYATVGGGASEAPVTPVDAAATVKINAASAGTLAFSGERAPDRVTAKLLNGGIVVYEGDYETLLSTDILSQSDAYYTLAVDAVWEQTDDAKYYGEVVYTAPLLFDVPATYELIGKKQVSIGDFTILKVYNFNADEKLFAECGYPMPEELYLYDMPGEACKFAFIPAFYSVNTAGNYDLKLTTSAGVAQSLSLRVREGKTASPASQDLLIDDADLRDSFTEAAFAEYRDKLAELSAASENLVYFDGKFSYPNAANGETRGDGLAKYGTYRTVRGGYTHSYYFDATEISATAGADVYAANAGKVVFAGDLALTGKTVIVDHGCSVLTVYGHLSEITAAEGTPVTKGSSLGKAGDTGFAAAASGVTAAKKPMIYYATVVGGVAINPAYMAYGVLFNG